jgi:hypothetical protein
MTLSLSKNSEILEVIEAVEAVECIEGLSRKPSQYGNVTFFGMNDEWFYTAYNTNNTCNDCADFDGQTFYGYELRSTFKYLVIIDENTIAAKVHPRCACVLSRVFNVEKLRRK